MLQKTILVCLTAIFLPNLAKTESRPLDLLRSELVRIGEDSIAQTARTELWIFRESNGASYAEALIEWLVGAEPFAGQPKLLLDENGPFDGAKAGTPSLAFVFLGSRQEDLKGASIFAQLGQIPIHTKLVVFFPFISIDNIWNVVRLFISVRLLTILYIIIHTDSSQFEWFNYYVHRDEVGIFAQYESLEQVFLQQTDLEGQTVEACTHSAGSFSKIDTVSGQPKGVDVHRKKYVNLLDTEKMNLM